MPSYALIPANVSFNVKGKEVDITDYEVEFAFENGSHYHESVSNAKGEKEYTLHQGSEVKPVGDMSVFIKKTPDKKMDKAIQALKDGSDAKKDNDPDKYTFPILFCLCDKKSKPFAKISFTGFIGEIKTYTDEDAAAGGSIYKATLEIFDTNSVQIKN